MEKGMIETKDQEAYDAGVIKLLEDIDNRFNGENVSVIYGAVAAISCRD